MTLQDLTGIGTILFDYDGTLHNSAESYVAAFHITYDGLVARGLAPERDFQRNEITRFLGYPPEEMWQLCLPSLPAEERSAAIARLGTVLRQRAADGKAQLYDGALETVWALRQKGYRTLLLSHCDQAYLDAHSKAFQLSRYFDALYCTESFGYAPKFEVFPQIVSAFPPQYLVVGDRKQDIEMGRRNGVRTIGCTYGFAADGELNDADVLISDIGALLSLPDAASSCGLSE